MREGDQLTNWVWNWRSCSNNSAFPSDVVTKPLSVMREEVDILEKFWLKYSILIHSLLNNSNYVVKIKYVINIQWLINFDQLACQPIIWIVEGSEKSSRTLVNQLMMERVINYWWGSSIL